MVFNNTLVFRVIFIKLIKINLHLKERVPQSFESHNLLHFKQAQYRTYIQNDFQ